jgi:hypothetical protein
MIFRQYAFFSQLAHSATHMQVRMQPSIVVVIHGSSSPLIDGSRVLLEFEPGSNRGKRRKSINGNLL